ncbi:hypothetical protein GCM10029964_091440 [Kibdelosporangium lantanae]
MKNARRIQTDIIPGTRPGHIAEVLSSGLFEPDPATHVDSPPDVVTSNVREAARAQLLGNARRSETVRVIQRVIPGSSLAKAVIAPEDAPLPSVRTVTVSEIEIERTVLTAPSGEQSRGRGQHFEEAMVGTTSSQGRERPKVLNATLRTGRQPPAGRVNLKEVALRIEIETKKEPEPLRRDSGLE